MNGIGLNTLNSVGNFLFHPFHDTHKWYISAASVVTLVALSILTCGIYTGVVFAVNLGQWAWTYCTSTPSSIAGGKGSQQVEYKDISEQEIKAFKRACSEGNIEEAAKFFDTLGVPVSITNSYSSRRDDYPLRGGLQATLSGDPSTKENRLEIAKQILKRDPKILQKPEIIVYNVLNSKDLKEFLAVLIDCGLDINSKDCLPLILVYVIDQGRLDMLDWLFENTKIKIDSKNISLSLNWIIADQIRNPSRKHSLDVYFTIGNRLLEKAKEVGAKATLFNESIYASPPVRDPFTSPGAKTIAQIESNELNESGLTNEFLKKFKINFRED